MIKDGVRLSEEVLLSHPEVELGTNPLDQVTPKHHSLLFV